MEDMIYHERQQSALCGVHCLNNLLQGSYFNASDLAEIAHSIDAREKSLMLESGHDSSNFLKFMAEDSGNVSDNGFFSVEVLRVGLQNAFNFTLLAIQSEEGKNAIKDPVKEQGFICNLEEHWFTIRQVGGVWYNFNSCFKEPEVLSQFYLSAFLDSLQRDGYSIFVVRGIFPKVVPQPYQPNWIRVSSLGANKRIITEVDLTQDSDDDLQKAIRASLGQFPDEEDEDEELRQAILLSQQEARLFVLQKVKNDFRENLKETNQEKCQQLYNTARDQLKLIHLSIPTSERRTCAAHVNLPDYEMSNLHSSTKQDTQKSINDTAKRNANRQIHYPRNNRSSDGVNTFHVEEPQKPLNTQSFVPKSTKETEYPRIVIKPPPKKLNEAYIDSIVDDFMQKL